MCNAKINLTFLSFISLTLETPWGKVQLGTWDIVWREELDSERLRLVFVFCILLLITKVH